MTPATQPPVAEQLLALAGGDPFEQVRIRSASHQREHDCGLHNAGGPQMHLVSTVARVANATSILDLGCGLGYSTLWLAAANDDATVIGIDDDPTHIADAQMIAHDLGYSDRVTYLCSNVAEVLSTVDGPVDMIHDDAWFARAPEHLDAVVDLLRSGGVLTMANWFLLVDALTGEQRNDWASFAGPDWETDTRHYAEHLAERSDLDICWLVNPPIGLATKK